MKVRANSIHDYLRATIENAQDHITTPPQLMYMVDHMDEIFQEEILTNGIEMHPTAGFLALNSYVMLLASVRQALSGHTVPVFPILRTALESACYAYLIAMDNSKAQIWLDRHKSQSSLNECRRTFTVTKTANELQERSAEMAEYVKAHYNACIDFGAHPNMKSIFNHLTKIDSPDDKYDAWELTGVYGPNSWYVNYTLLACVEVGQAIAFLIAASSESHPLLNERLTVFQDWMDEKNRMAEEINGKPIDYTGPMYSSVVPPASQDY
ncbi:hypothetical protein HRV96_14990 [Raoultella ornithinolytica]|uniref:hypothetical protein n=1 Tax=Raoultella ornithinolytica TaxID=54291 RepID=UPI001F3FBF9E|nr:hypothetical protein [Raoultella ornithinolytica]UIZ74495.1 hypothetical protein HRV96_14990 [Raoultella ornithinolytica]